MARVPYRSAEDLPEADRAMMSRPINLFRALANSPDALRQFHPFGEWIRWECELDPRLRELAILQVGYLARSPYEFSHHLALSRQFGVTDSDIEGLIAESEGRESSLPELDRLVLRATREITDDRVASDETWSELEKHFSPARLVDLVVVVSFYSMVVRVLGTLQIDNEPEYQKELDGYDWGQEAQG